MNEMMTQLAAQKDEIQAPIYCSVLEEICKLLGQLGKVLKIAFDDVKDKAAKIGENK